MENQKNEANIKREQIIIKRKTDQELFEVIKNGGNFWKERREEKRFRIKMTIKYKTSIKNRFNNKIQLKPIIDWSRFVPNKLGKISKMRSLSFVKKLSFFQEQNYSTYWKLLWKLLFFICAISFYLENLNCQQLLGKYFGVEEEEKTLEEAERVGKMFWRENSKISLEWYLFRKC